MTSRFPALAALLLSVTALPALATDYYVAPRPGSGSGTAADPFGLEDLPQGNPGCRATMILQPGDTLYFKGGDYHLHGNPGRGGYPLPLLNPAQSGTATRPITLASAPGEEARLFDDDAGSNPMLGTLDRHHVRIIGFTVFRGVEWPAIRVSQSQDVEVGYCRVIGKYVPTADNHDGIRLDSAERAWVHHCEVTGVKGDGGNSAAVKLYHSKDTRIEDCFLHDCRTGFHDKMNGVGTIVRRCVLVDCEQVLVGNVAMGWDGEADMTIEECVLGGPIVLMGLTRGTKIHDNLLFADNLADAIDPSQTQLEIWNNVVISPSPTLRVLDLRRTNWLKPGQPKSPVAYLDYNLYATAAGPEPQVVYALGQYSPPMQTLTFAAMRSQGLEGHSRLIRGGRNAVLERDGSRVQARWAKAGREGDMPGPEDIAALMRRDRFGPAARPQ